MKERNTGAARVYMYARVYTHHRNHPATFFSRDAASAALPPGHWEFFSSLVRSYVCMCKREPTHPVCVYVRTITPITSHTSVCGGDEDEKKPAEMRAGGKKDPDCESPVGAKDVYVARSRFALSDRSRGLLCSHCTSTLHLSLSPRLFARMMGGKVASAGWTEYIYSRWVARECLPVHDASVSFLAQNIRD